MGSYHLRMRSNNGSVSRAVNLSAWHDVTLRLWVKVSSFESSDHADLRVTPDGANWTMLHSWTSADSDGVYRYYEFPLTGLTMSSNFTVAVDTHMSSTNDSIYIDDVELVGYLN